MVHGLVCPPADAQAEASRTISWTAFIAAAQSSKVCQAENSTAVKAAFAAIDADQDGLISLDDIMDVLGGNRLSQALKLELQRNFDDMRSMPETAPSEKDKPNGLVRFASKVKGAMSRPRASEEQFLKYMQQQRRFLSGSKFFPVII